MSKPTHPLQSDAAGNIYYKVDDAFVKVGDIDDIAAPEADGVVYDNASSGLTATDVQAAIDEVNSATSALLDSAQHNPAGQTNYGTTDTSFADLDATNLEVTFDAPSSGSVIVKFTGQVNVSSGTNLSWNVRDSGGSDVADTKGKVGGASGVHRAHHAVRVDGLTPGQSYTWRWGHARIVGSGDAFTYVGGDAGPLLMEVWAA